jgi:hypothetical protein
MLPKNTITYNEIKKITNKSEKIMGNATSSNSQEIKLRHEVLAAFVKAKKNFKPLAFNKKVKYFSSGKETTYEYADLAEVLDNIEKPLANEGFVIAHELSYDAESEWLTTYLQHESGERVGYCKFPIEIKGKTPQQVGTQITYFKRYSICCICSLAADPDDDAKSIEKQELGESLLTKEQVAKLDMIKIILKKLPQSEVPGVLKTFGISKIEELPAAKFDKAIEFLNKRIAVVSQPSNGG